MSEQQSPAPASVAFEIDVKTPGSPCKGKNKVQERLETWERTPSADAEERLAKAEANRKVCVDSSPVTFVLLPLPLHFEFGICSTAIENQSSLCICTQALLDEKTSKCREKSEKIKEGLSQQRELVAEESKQTAQQLEERLVSFCLRNNILLV